jgi:transposase
MYKLTFEKCVWIVKQVLRGVTRVKVALAQKVSYRAVRYVMETYAQHGWDGLHDHKTGRSEIVLNRTVEIIIVDLRRRFGYGACRIEQLLKQKGFLISHR